MSNRSARRQPPVLPLRLPPPPPISSFHLPEDHRKASEDRVLLLRREANDVHRLDCLGEVRLVIDRGNVEATRPGGVDVGLGSLDAKRLALLIRGALGELIEDVKVALVFDLADDAALKEGWGDMVSGN